MTELERDIKKGAARQSTGNTTIASQIKCGNMALEDHEWEKADSFFGAALNLEPECAEAYLGKLLARERNPGLVSWVATQKEKHADAASAEITDALDDRIAKAQKEDQTRIECVKTAFAAHISKADEISKTANQNAQSRREEHYQSIVTDMENVKDIPAYEKARDDFNEMKVCSDCVDLADKCQNEIDSLVEANDQELAHQNVMKKEGAKQKAFRLIKAIADYLASIVFCASVGVAVVVVGTIIIGMIAIPNNEYDKACELLGIGMYDEAITAFEALGGYKDSENKLAVAQSAKIEAHKLANINPQIGDTYYFGQYEQDDNTDNGKEYIEWRILDKDGDKVLLLSEECLDSKAYNEEEEYSTWEKSTLRRWLNDDFEEEAFSSEERKAIVNTDVKNDDNKEYGTRGGKDTKDDIFLLSINEAEDYFYSDKEREAKGTEYAENNGLYVDCDNWNSWWWLRSPGNDGNSAALVYDDGSVDTCGNDVDSDSSGIRPACWVNISNL